MIAIASEFSSCEFNDLRLTKRAQKLSEQIANNPDNSIHAACGSAADSKAAYRFFDNNNIKPELILQGHANRVAERIKDYENVLVLHDTTDLIYTQFPSMTELGERQRTKGFESGIKALHLHNSLATSEVGVPLGLLKQTYFTHDDYSADRDPNTKNVPGACKNLPIESKESFRWINHLMATDKQVKDSGAEAIHVGDRECDIYEFFQIADEINSRFVVRSCSNRKIQVGRTTRDTLTVQSCLDNARSVAEVKVKKDGQTHICNVKAISVILARPHRHPGAQSIELTNLEVNLVEVRCQDRLIGSPHWRLLTNLDIENTKDILRVINIYKSRWAIECYHRVLKSGFGVEKSRLGTRLRLENMASIMSIVAWYIFWLYNFGRAIPSAAADAIFSEQAIEILKISAKKLKVPLQGKLNVREAILILARLGGFPGRKSDGEPGMICIWRGWNKLQERIEFMEELTYG